MPNAVDHLSAPGWVTRPLMALPASSVPALKYPLLWPEPDVRLGCQLEDGPLADAEHALQARQLQILDLLRHAQLLHHEPLQEQAHSKTTGHNIRMARAGWSG